MFKMVIKIKKDNVTKVIISGLYRDTKEDIHDANAWFIEQVRQIVAEGWIILESYSVDVGD